MKKTIHYFAFALFGLLLVVSCKKDDSPSDDEVGELLDAPLTDIQVKVPEGSGLNPSELKVFSFLENFDINPDGSSKAILNSEGMSFAYVFNDLDEPILMGIITDTNKELSVKSTIEAAVYFSLGTVFLPSDVQKKYFEESSKLPDLQDIENKITEIYTNNPSPLNSQEFSTIIKEYTENLLNDGETIDLSSKRIEVDKNDVKSGIQLETKSSLSLSIINNYRRRAHGFSYKMSVTDDANNTTTLINDIKTDKAAPTKDVAVKQTKEFTQLTATTTDIGSGVGIGFARTESEDITFELGDNDKEAQYKIRVVGPSFISIGDLDGLTQTELDKLLELQEETLLFDLTLPILMGLTGHLDLLKGLDEKRFKGYEDALSLFAQSLPAVQDAAKEGDLKKMLNELLLAMYNNRVGGNVENILTNLFQDITEISKDKTSYFVNNADRIKSSVKKTVNIIKLVDLILLTNDVLIRQGSAFAFSSALEEWDVKAKQSNVTLVLKDPIALPGISADMEAVVQDLQLAAGESLEYRWSTSGNYGILKDEFGKEDTSFTSTRANVKYVVTASDDQITDESFDGLKVEVYLKKGQSLTLLNEDSQEIQVRAIGMRLKPNDITVQGNTSINMYLTRTDGTPVIPENSTFDYRVVWETSGSHGAFAGGKTVVTTVNETTLEYKCTDWISKTGTENFKAKIYTKKKEDTDYKLLDVLEASLKIENDDNKKIFYVPIQVKSEPWQGDGISVWTPFSFAPRTYPGREVVSYRLTIMERTPELIPRCAGSSKTWFPENEANDLNEDGEYSLICGSGQAGPFYVAQALAFANSSTGYAKVEVTLKPL